MGIAETAPPADSSVTASDISGGKVPANSFHNHVCSYTRHSEVLWHWVDNHSIVN